MPDATLPNPSVATPRPGSPHSGGPGSGVSNNGTPYSATTVITGGTSIGANQFHSFAEFSIPAGQRALFELPAATQNVITRVTGSQLSQIDGGLEVSGPANFFLINPNGIQFGPEASLQMGGSFLATTADRVVFADGASFSAAAPQAPSLLSVNIPVGLQYGPQAQPIQVTSRSRETGGLVVAAGKTLALVGGDVQLDGGQLVAQGGRVELGGVGPNAAVGIKPDARGFELEYASNSLGRDIRMTQGASLDADRGGEVALYGRNIQLLEGSTINANTLGAEAGGHVALTAGQQVLLQGGGGSGASGISANVLAGATGAGSNVVISTPQLHVLDGGQISVRTFGQGRGGDLKIHAGEIDVIGDLTANAQGQITNPRISSINTRVEAGATGDGGNITLRSDRLRISDGGEVSTATRGGGDAGNLDIQTNTLAITGKAVEYPTGLFTTAFASGNGGDIDLRANAIEVRNGGKIKAETESSGNAGSISIQADHLLAQGLLSNNSVSFISTSVRGADTTGNGGHLSIAVNRLQILDGAQIAAGTLGLGNAGGLEVMAQDIEISGAPAGFTNGGGLLTIAGNGHGGDLNVQADRILVRDGGVIRAGSQGRGQSGQLTISAREIEVRGSSPNGDSGPSRISSSVTVMPGTNNTPSTGAGGNVEIRTNSLRLIDGGQVSASTSTAGNAGQVNIGADRVDISGTSPSGQFASGLFTTTGTAATGRGGSIEVNASQLQVTGGGQVSASTSGGSPAGNVKINAGTVVVAGTGTGPNGTPRSSSITAAAQRSTNPNAPSLNTSGSAGSVEINADSLSLNDQARISVSNTLGAGDAGNLVIRARNLVLDNRSSLSADVQAGAQGNIAVNADTITLRRGSSITTNATGDATGGNITLSSRFLFAVEYENSDITANAQNSFGGRVTVNALGVFGTRFRLSPTLNSDITASSARGSAFSGQVAVRTPQTEPAQRLDPLPDALIDSRAQIRASCDRLGSNGFIATGRGGVPEDPQQLLQGSAPWRDLRAKQLAIANPTVSTSSQRPAPTPVNSPLNSPANHAPEAILEAQSWRTTSTGELQLVALRPQADWQTRCREFVTN